MPPHSAHTRSAPCRIKGRTNAVTYLQKNRPWYLCVCRSPQPHFPHSLSPLQFLQPSLTVAPDSVH